MSLDIIFSTFSIKVIVIHVVELTSISLFKLLEGIYVKSCSILNSRFVPFFTYPIIIIFGSETKINHGSTDLSLNVD